MVVQEPAKKYLKLEDINAYVIASELGDVVWDLVSKWDWFAKRTIGAQLVDSIDSIAANIAEGFGRYHKKDKQKFYYNSRGSAYESAHWIKKARQRRLIDDKQFDFTMDRLQTLPKSINQLIKYTSEKLTI